MTKITPNNHFTIVHRTRRRVRIVAPSLRKDQERAYLLQKLLGKRPGIIAIKIVPAIASVSVQFDPDVLPLANLLQLLEKVIANLGLKPRITHKSRQHKHLDSEPLHLLEFTVNGMSCPSCALYLELVLQRDEHINKANVNFETKAARINTTLTPEAIIQIVAGYGFQASVAEQPRPDTAAQPLKPITFTLLSVPLLLSGLLLFRSANPVACAQSLFRRLP